MAQAVLQFDRPPADQSARDFAVDVRESVIVQAPAGSGKTSLLTERFLRLLATVDGPRRVLAITFTRSAAAEMRSRVLDALRYVAGETATAPKGPRSLLRAAEEALGASRDRGWDLLEQPEQLNIQTIDSLALSIAQQTPLTTWLGAGLAPMENAAPFYKQAALKTLQKLELSDAAGPRDRQTAEAVAVLLRHRDNEWQKCAALLARMLATRDQWGRLFPLHAEALEDAYLDFKLRPALEAHLRGAVERHLQDTREHLVARKDLCRRLLTVARFVIENSPEDLTHHGAMAEAPGHAATELPRWLLLCDLCMTQGGTPLKKFDKNSGFLPGVSEEMKREAKAVAAKICDDETMHGRLQALRDLPPPKFSDDEWAVAKAMFRLLQQAVLELQMAFAESGRVDFVEIGLAALQALGSGDGGVHQPSDLALAWGEQLQHLLVDEFQDTSRTHNALVGKLIANWDAGDGRSFFCVGDPQQSIYLFRQAEVRLFQQVIDHGIAALRPVLQKLTVNFRSQQPLVNAHNDTLKKIFEGSEVAFVSSTAHAKASARMALHWHFSAKPPSSARREEKDAAQERGAEHACDLAAAALAAPESTVAILVRAKAHAGPIMRCLHERKIGFRAIDMEPLSDRQEVLDAYSLTRAILNPADRVAWLALLRAPWCGLGLAALNALAGDAKTETIAASIASRITNLAEEEHARTRHVLQVMQEAQAQLRDARLPFLTWQAWQRIGGDAWVNAEQYENVIAYFAMLERMDEDGAALNCDTIEAEMQRLCAAPNPDPAAARLEILTIHKAKGLEWDTVIVPQLDRQTGRNDAQAVEWIEDQVDDDAAWFLAPVDAHGSERSALRLWIWRRQKEREADEAKRLFYVAATRARNNLHLLGAVVVKEGKLSAPYPDSLLRTAWPAAQAVAEEQLLKAAVQLELPAMAAAGDSTITRNTLRRLPLEWFREHLASETKAPVAEQPAGARLKACPSESTGTSAQLESIPQQTTQRRVIAVTAMPRDFATRAGHERRMAGTALHAFLEQAARRRAEGDDWTTLQAWAKSAGSRVERLLLAAGMPPSRMARYAPNVQKLLQNALASNTGQWVLESRPNALTEYGMKAWNGESFAGFRVDRVFLAGSAPLTEGQSHLWIVDYKSAALAGKQPDNFLATQAAAYSETMLRYAHALRGTLNEALPIHCALYFPALDLVHQLGVLD